ncbi:GAF domain-containing protein [Almyronema epifaneia]|uniref:GAF domain-containing protein n=1 Tax=Almyronema epifaneia S1 TaxID=2991925 RepID=A0ABW6IIK6_9CYAN
MTLEQIAQQAQTLTQAETAVLAWIETETATVYYVAAVGKQAAAIAGKRGQIATSGLCGVVFQQSCPILVAQTQGDNRVRQDQVAALGIETALAVPLRQADQIVGVLMVLNRQDGSLFDAAAQQQLERYAAEISQAVATLVQTDS